MKGKTERVFPFLNYGDRIPIFCDVRSQPGNRSCHAFDVISPVNVNLPPLLCHICNYIENARPRTPFLPVAHVTQKNSIMSPEFTEITELTEIPEKDLSTKGH